MAGTDEADRAFTEAGFYRTSQGLCIVDSPTRARILRLLGSGELTFEEIVSHTGRAKSTVSVHLRELVADGVLGSRSDPSDGRRKYFYIDAEYLGKLSDTERLEDDFEQLLADYDHANPDPASFYRAVLRTIRVALLGNGINIDPILYIAGRRLGHGLAAPFGDLATGQLLAALGRFWDQHALGRLEVVAESPVELVVYDCFECMDLPFIGRPACAFDQGFLTAVFEDHFNSPIHVVESACYAMGSGHCRFTIEPVAEV